jgi:N-methylhydantoinase A
VQARSALAEVDRVEPISTESCRDSDEKRRIYDAREQQFIDARVYQRNALHSGELVVGPAVIIESETSTIVTNRYEAVVQNDGCLLLRRKGQKHAN